MCRRGGHARGHHPDRRLGTDRVGDRLRLQPGGLRRQRLRPAATAGPATSSALSLPSGVAVDAQGDVYIADTDNSDVEKVTPSGTLSIVAGDGNPGFPTAGPASNSQLFAQGIAVDASDNLYVADYQASEVVKISATGTLSIIAGNSGGSGRPTPGSATASSLGEPWGIAVDAAGDVYIADYSNQVIEEVTPSGTLSIFAGTGTAGAPTPGPATASDLNYPTGLAIDSQGNLYVADSVNSMIEKITPSGTLSIVAGNGTAAAPVPGPASSSPLDNPFGVAVDAAGDIYISDTSNNEIEEVTPAGTLSIIAGDGSAGPPTYGPATNTTLWAPNDIASTPAGALYVADTSNSTIDLLTPPAPTLTAAATITGTTTVGQTAPPAREAGPTRRFSTPTCGRTATPAARTASRSPARRRAATRSRPLMPGTRFVWS